ncbi:hypothetical protein ACIH2S_17325 [Providencia sp. PAZ2]|uniref:hypothetical protein n=1 Tax=Providencia lanzhouensis TaxID=3378099 RepID=UPI003D2DE533
MFINTHLLSEPELYKMLCSILPDLMRGRSLLKEHTQHIKQIAYASWHKSNSLHIDQVFHQHWENLWSRKEEEKSLSRALLNQVARYHFVTDPRYLAIRLDRFSEWQNWLANQSGLPVIAAKMEGFNLFNKEEIDIPAARHLKLKGLFGFRTLISPTHPLVEDYIEQHGLNESHMHLNGTTPLESMWHFSLCHPNVILQDLESEYKKPRVQLLYAVNNVLNHPKDYERLLKIARRLRQLLLVWVKSHSNIDSYKDSVYHILKNENTNFNEGAVSFSLDSDFFHQDNHWAHITEIDFHISVLAKLKEKPSDAFDICYLLYLLCLNNFQHILVQRNDQYGFDQFQKFADAGIRETYEKDYEARFHQLHGAKSNGRPDLATLEGRFAPKNKSEKNEHLISAILRGFLSYAQGKSPINNNCDLNRLAEEVLQYKRPNFKLVAHFIKLPWKRNEGPHHYNVRKVVMENAFLLFELLNNNPKLRNIITGIDAAANELEAPPEVFAELYRYCRRNDIRHFTYHVGEDFEHLLNGIRAVYEAITFLDLKNGDRLGHATAIGISPKFWINQMPDSLFLTQGSWLENLLFLRHISLNDPSVSFSLSHLESQINQLSYLIFNENIELDNLQLFFNYRGLSPTIVQDKLQDPNKLHLGSKNEEYNLLKGIDDRVLSILEKRWFNRKIIEQYEKKKEFDLDAVTYEMLLKAQQFVQGIVAKKQIIIETLPTSNVRISLYSSMKEHHVFRWIQVPERIIEGDRKMLVSLGSDDPGIFVTDMRNEFYHIFSTLTEVYGYTERDALNETAKINENGRIYQFKGPHEAYSPSLSPRAEK